MRNLLAFHISEVIGMPYTPYGRSVDVILNGEYKGCYQLCDQIEVNKNRVNIDEMETSDISGEALTGGYLWEIDAYADQEVSWFNSNHNIPVTIKSPDEEDITPEQSKYVADFFNKMEETVYATYFDNKDYGWRSILDAETFLKHFLIGELSGNTDTYWSVYQYKKRGEDKAYTGPVWDFDIAFDNDNRNSYASMAVRRQVVWGSLCAVSCYKMLKRYLNFVRYGLWLVAMVLILLVYACG